MARRSAKGGRALKDWRKRQDPSVTQEALGRDVGVSGSAIRHFENQTKGFRLALAVKVKLALRTGIALEMMVTPEELALARELVAVMARDAAA